MKNLRLTEAQRWGHRLRLSVIKVRLHEVPSSTNVLYTCNLGPAQPGPSLLGARLGLFAEGPAACGTHTHRAPACTHISADTHARKHTLMSHIKHSCVHQWAPPLQLPLLPTCSHCHLFFSCTQREVLRSRALRTQPGDPRASQDSAWEA